jgi:hypothetical protein
MLLRPAPDAKFWYRLYSVRFLILGTAFSGMTSVFFVFGYLPWGQQHPFMLLAVAAVIQCLALISRLVNQPSVPQE